MVLVEAPIEGLEQFSRPEYRFRIDYTYHDGAQIRGIMILNITGITIRGDNPTSVHFITEGTKDTIVDTVYRNGSFASGSVTKNV